MEIKDKMRSVGDEESIRAIKACFKVLKLVLMLTIPTHPFLVERPVQRRKMECAPQPLNRLNRYISC